MTDVITTYQCKVDEDAEGNLFVTLPDSIFTSPRPWLTTDKLRWELTPEGVTIINESWILRNKTD